MCDRLKIWQSARLAVCLSVALDTPQVVAVVAAHIHCFARSINFSNELRNFVRSKAIKVMI